MNFTEEQIAFRDSVRRMVERHVAPIAAEIDEKKREFIMKVFPDLDILFRSSKALTGSSAKCWAAVHAGTSAHPRRKAIPTPKAWFAGFPCTDASQCSSRRTDR